MQCLINTRLAKTWTAVNRLSVIWKSDLTDEKHSFFQAAVVLILLYGCTTWTPTKRMEKKLDGNYTKMLWAILSNSWRQHRTKQQYGHLSPITKTIPVWRTRHTGHCWSSKDKIISDILLWTPLHMDEQRQDVQLEPKYNSSVPIHDVVWKTYRERRTIETGGRSVSGKSVLVDDDDDDDFYNLFFGIR